MDFDLTVEEARAQKAAFEVAGGYDLASPLDARRTRQLIAKLAEKRLLDAGAVSLVLTLMEIAKRSAPAALAVAAHAAFFELGRSAGREELAGAGLSEFTNGRKIGSVCSGSLEVREAGGRWVLDGDSGLVINGPIVDTIAVWPGKDSGPAFIVNMKSEGVKRGAAAEELAMEQAPRGTIEFDRVQVAHSERFEGQAVQNASWGFRVGVAAVAAGIAKVATEESVRLLIDQSVTHGPSSARQGDQFTVSDIATDADATTLLCLRAATLRDRGGPYGTEAASAKLFGAQAAARATARALSVFGDRAGPLQERRHLVAQLLGAVPPSSARERNDIAGEMVEE